MQVVPKKERKEKTAKDLAGEAVMKEEKEKEEKGRKTAKDHSRSQRITPKGGDLPLPQAKRKRPFACRRGGDESSTICGEWLFAWRQEE